jgi:hypothetical protein
MPYQFAIQNEDYTDFAGGRVLYSLPGLPAFPVRLASEIFLRACAALRLPVEKRLTIYDPTCGGAYHLTALGLLHGESIGAILASDVDGRALELAGRNLGLLSPAGLQRREQEIRGMLDQFGKPSHVEALHSAIALRERMLRMVEGEHGLSPIRTRVFQANALDPASVLNALAGETVHLVISDIPYGQLSAWTLPGGDAPGGQSPAWRLLDTLLPALPGDSIIAIAADKSQKIAHAGYRRVERFQIGKRRVSLLSPAAS